MIAIFQRNVQRNSCFICCQLTYEHQSNNFFLSFSAKCTPRKPENVLKIPKNIELIHNMVMTGIIFQNFQFSNILRCLDGGN